jgi:hypothetical protein
MIRWKKKMLAKERPYNKIVALLLIFLVIDLAGHSLAAAETDIDIDIDEIVGKITSIDAAATIVTIKTRQGEMSVYITEKTQITMGREEKLFSDLKVGDKIKVHYTISEGKELALRIMVKPHKEKDCTKKGLDQ